LDAKCKTALLGGFHCIYVLNRTEFNFTFKWVDDGAYGFKNKDSGEWNGLMGELLAQVGSYSTTVN